MWRRPLAVTIIAIVLVTALFWATSQIHANHMEESVKIARRTTDAAKRSAEALPILERSYVFMEIDPAIINGLWPILRQSIKTGEIIFVRYRYINHGKTPAIIKTMSARFVHLSELPGDIRYIDYINIGEIIIPARDAYPAPIEMSVPAVLSNPPRKWVEEYRYQERLSIELDNVAIDSLQKGQSFLWFYGHIVYDDIFTSPYETAFCWRIDGTTGRFNRYGDKHNYAN